MTFAPTPEGEYSLIYCFWFFQSRQNLNRFGILNLKMIEFQELFSSFSSSSSSRLLTHQKLHEMAYGNCHAFQSTVVKSGFKAVQSPALIRYKYDFVVFHVLPSPSPASAYMTYWSQWFQRFHKHQTIQRCQIQCQNESLHRKDTM